VLHGDPSFHANGDVRFLWEMENLTPCKIEILEQIDTQFVGLIMSTSGTFVLNW